MAFPEVLGHQLIYIKKPQAIGKRLNTWSPFTGPLTEDLSRLPLQGKLGSLIHCFASSPWAYLYLPTLLPHTLRLCKEA